MIGTSLGPYKIIEQLGAGGMGEVYLGEDTRLGRKVAIKVLPEEYASDPERLARFEQEARAAAALNHPHIAVVHDIGTEGDIHFMVQEYLEGQSLRERLKKGALPLDKALDLVTEVGEALIAAHKAGIIHRDLKPDNIFVTEEGHAKVLDFGLAKLTEMAAPAGSEATMSPTMLGTVAGQVMGTAGYMAPEQVKGAEIDHRADLFAFGAVLYETVTGRRAFSGSNIHETLNRILTEEPPSIAEADGSVPAELQRIVRKSLAKSSGSRYQTAADMVIDLLNLSKDIETGTAQTLLPSPRGLEEDRGTTPWLRIAITTVLVAGAAVAGWWFARSNGSTQATTARFTIDLTNGTTLPIMSGRTLAISSDGQTIVYTERARDGTVELRRRRLDEFESYSIPGTEGAGRPYFSPDGDWLSFRSFGEIKKVPLSGGEAFTVCAQCTFGAWGDDGNIVFLRGDELWRVAADLRSEEEPLTESLRRHFPNGVRRLTVLPGSKAVLLEHGFGMLFGGIYVVSLETSEIVEVSAEGSEPIYVATGHILFARGNTLFAVPFDVDRLEVSGQPTPVLEGVQVETGGASPADDHD